MEAEVVVCMCGSQLLTGNSRPFNSVTRDPRFLLFRIYKSSLRSKSFCAYRVIVGLCWYILIKKFWRRDALHVTYTIVTFRLPEAQAETIKLNVPVHMKEKLSSFPWNNATYDSRRPNLEVDEISLLFESFRFHHFRKTNIHDRILGQSFPDINRAYCAVSYDSVVQAKHLYLVRRSKLPTP